ncbi:hypothetical protein SpCBS45565_g00022 [Spizellomyces sp. 'palustris']|nr:hypothetical protein SpCBS45565_g00022 [Spizellomyces sp. 'palustris']
MRSSPGISVQAVCYLRRLVADYLGGVSRLTPGLCGGLQVHRHHGPAGRRQASTSLVDESASSALPKKPDIYDNAWGFLSQSSVGKGKRWRHLAEKRRVTLKTEQDSGSSLLHAIIPLSLMRSREHVSELLKQAKSAENGAEIFEKVVDRLSRADLGRLPAEQADRIVLAYALSMEGNMEGAVLELTGIHSSSWTHDLAVDTCHLIFDSCAKNGRSRFGESLLDHLIAGNNSLHPKYAVGGWRLVEGYASEGDLEAADRLLVRLCGMGYIPSKQALKLLLSQHQIALRQRERDVETAMLSIVWGYFTTVRKAAQGDQIPRKSDSLLKARDRLYLELLKQCVAYGGLTQGAQILACVHARHADLVVYGYNLLLTGHVSAGSIENASKVYRLMLSEDVKPNLSTFNILLQACIQAGSYDGAETLIQEMARRGIAWTATSYRHAIQLRVHQNNLLGAKQLVQQFVKDGLKVDEKIITHLMTGYARSRDMGGAIGLLNFFEEQGVQVPLNVAIFNKLLYACVGGSTGEVERLREIMIEHNVNPNSETYVNLASHYAAVGDAERCMTWLEKSEISAADTRMINRVLSQFAQTGETDKIQDVIKKLERRGVKFKIDTYNILIKSISKTGQPKDAEKVLDDLKGKGVHPDTITYNTMMAIYVRHDDLKSANRLFRTMASLDKPVKPDRFTYATLMDAHAKLGMMEVASRLYSTMQMRGIKADHAVYHTLLKGFCQMGDATRVKQIIDEMHADGLSPTTLTYNVISAGLIQRGAVDEAEWWINHMRQAGVRGDLYTYNQRIQLFVAKRDMPAAEAVFAEMSTDAIRPDATTFNTLITGWYAVDKPEEARHLIRKMRSYGVVPNFTTCTIRISFYVKIGDMERAELAFHEWFSKAKKKHPIASEPFAALIYGWGTIKRNLPAALSWWTKMENAGAMPNSSVYTCLMQAHSHAHGSLESILHIFDRLIERRDGPSVGVEAPTACVALDACGRFNSVNAVREVWNRLKHHSIDVKIARWEWENVYTSYLEALIRCGEFELAVKVLTEEMVASKVIPSVKTFETCLTLLETRNADPKFVVSVEKFMTRWPDVATQVYVRVATFKQQYEERRRESMAAVGRVRTRGRKKGIDVLKVPQ